MVNGEEELVELEVRDLTVRYGHFEALEGISFNGKGGDLISIIGPNGSGKSTLLKALSGILRPFKGYIKVNERFLSELTPKELARLISYCPTYEGNSADLTVWELVMIGRYPRMGMLPGKRDIYEVTNSINLLSLSNLLSRRLRELSDGERRRASIAKALAQGSRIMLLDEPLAHLDLRNQLSIMELLRKKADEGSLIIITSHEINVPAPYSDIMIMLREGKVLAIGAPNEVLTEKNIKALYGIRVKVIKENERMAIILLGVE